MTSKKVEVRFSRRFLKDLKLLQRRYTSVREDIGQLIESLKRGETPGDRLKLVKGYIVYKIRLRIQSTTKGKSGGYRVIYWLRTSDSIILVTIYVKSDRSDISSDEVKRILNDYISQQDPDTEG